LNIIKDQGVGGPGEAKDKLEGLSGKGPFQYPK